MIKKLAELLDKENPDKRLVTILIMDGASYYIS
jgi:hypothetical protein